MVYFVKYVNILKFELLIILLVLYVNNIVKRDEVDDFGDVEFI